MTEAKAPGNVITLPAERERVLREIGHWEARRAQEIADAINTSDRFAADVVPMKE